MAGFISSIANSCHLVCIDFERICITGKTSLGTYILIHSYIVMRSHNYLSSACCIVSYFESIFTSFFYHSLGSILFKFSLHNCFYFCYLIVDVGLTYTCNLFISIFHDFVLCINTNIPLNTN